MWCEREFELSNSDDAICSMYETVDAGYQWTDGEFFDYLNIYNDVHNKKKQEILQFLHKW